MWPPMWTSNAALRPVRLAPWRSKSAKDMQRSSRLQSTNTGRAAGRRIASGVAMNVFEGQSTGSPAHAGELERRQRARPTSSPKATEPSPFQAAHAASKRVGHRPLGPALGVDDLVPQRVQRARSRRSKPIANWVWSGPAPTNLARF